MVPVYKRSHAQVKACLGDVIAEVVGTAKLLKKCATARTRLLLMFSCSGRRHPAHT